MLKPGIVTLHATLRLVEFQPSLTSLSVTNDFCFFLRLKYHEYECKDPIKVKQEKLILCARFLSLVA